MYLDEFEKSPQVIESLRRITAAQLVALDMLFLNMMLDPFSKMFAPSLSAIVIDGSQYDILRGSFYGADVSMIFGPSDDMYIVSLIPNILEIDGFLTMCENGVTA